MKILCTYCSKKKDKSKELLPAYKRYEGKHIKTVYNIAKKKGNCFISYPENMD